MAEDGRALCIHQVQLLLKLGYSGLLSEARVQAAFGDLQESDFTTSLGKPSMLNHSQRTEILPGVLREHAQKSSRGQRLEDRPQVKHMAAVEKLSMLQPVLLNFHQKK